MEEWGWRMRGRTVASCHMFTNSADIEELHSFAVQLGMKRTWFQPHAVAPHYDLVKSRRDLAVSLGAVEVGRRQASSIWRARRELVGAPQPRKTHYCGKLRAARTCFQVKFQSWMVR